MFVDYTPSPFCQGCFFKSWLADSWVAFSNILHSLSFRAYFHFFTQRHFPPSSNIHIIYFAAFILRFPATRASNINYAGKFSSQLGPYEGHNFMTDASSGKALDKPNQADMTTANAIPENINSKCKSRSLGWLCNFAAWLSERNWLPISLLRQLNGWNSDYAVSIPLDAEECMSQYRPMWLISFLQHRDFRA